MNYKVKSFTIEVPLASGSGSVYALNVSEYAMELVESLRRSGLSQESVVTRLADRLWQCSPKPATEAKVIAEAVVVLSARLLNEPLSELTREDLMTDLVKELGYIK